MSQPPPSRVLLVDDDAESQELYVEILRWAGFDVQTASDGEAAIAAVADGVPELVVLDIELPVRDGVEVLRELRKIPGTQGIPVIALTGIAEAADRARVYGGFTAVLEKPCDPHSLITTLRRALTLTGDGVPGGSEAPS